MMKTTTVLMIFFLLIYSCIKKEENICPKEFELQGEITPYQDIFHVGDTIFLSNHFYKFVKEKTTGIGYDLKDISFYSGFGIIKIDSGNSIQPSRKKYIHLIECSDSNVYWYSYSSSEDEVLLAGLSKSNDSLKLDIKISLTTPGLFLIEFGSGVMDCRQDFEGKCGNVSFDAYTRLNAGKDNNIGLLKQSTNEYYNNWIYTQKERFYKRGSFVIRVLE